MASEKPDKKERKKDKEKSKRSEADGVHKSKEKKEKKEKKSKKEKLAKEIAAHESEVINELDEKLQADAAKDTPMEEEDAKPKPIVAVPVVVGAMVPFAKPLADEKGQRKVLKSVRKSAKAKTLRRGVKEVVKALRKSAPATPSSLSQTPLGVVVLAGDISPPDVISHLPVLCEDHAVPYIFVASRAELGAAGATKRPTSVVMVCKDRVGGQGKKDKEEKNGEEEDEGEDYGKTYEDLVKLVQKEVWQLRPYL